LLLRLARTPVAQFAGKQAHPDRDLAELITAAIEEVRLLAG
jgi:hypothetical protein